VNDGKEMGGERRFRENAWYRCSRRLRSGSYRTNTAFYLNNQVKRISWQTGLWWRRYTRGFGIDNYLQLRNDNASCRRATQCDDGDGCLAPEARRHTIGCCHVAQHVGNCVFWRLEKILLFY